MGRVSKGVRRGNVIPKFLSSKESYVVVLSQHYDDVLLVRGNRMDSSVDEIKKLIKTGSLAIPKKMKESVYSIYIGTIEQCEDVIKRVELFLQEADQDHDNGMLLRNKKSATATSSSISKSAKELPNKDRRIAKDVTELTAVEISSNIRELKWSVNDMQIRIDEILKKIDEVSKKITEGSLQEASEFVDESLKLLDDASSVIQTKRKSKKWKDNVMKKQYSWLSDEENDDISKILRTGSRVPSKLIIALANVVFGKKTIKENILGTNGKSLREAREGDRQSVISLELENRFKEVLKNLDNIFIENWNELVRGPVNQHGRQLRNKEAKNRKRRLEKESDANSIISGINSLNNNEKRQKTGEVDNFESDKDTDSDTSQRNNSDLLSQSRTCDNDN